MRRRNEESVVQAAILRFLAGEPRIRIWRNNTGRLPRSDGQWISFGLEGSADLLGLLAPEGRFLAIECKSPSGRPSVQQRAFGGMIERFGGVFVLARSVDDVRTALTPWLTDTKKLAPRTSAAGP